MSAYSSSEKQAFLSRVFLLLQSDMRPSRLPIIVNAHFVNGWNPQPQIDLLCRWDGSRRIQRIIQLKSSLNLFFCILSSAPFWQCRETFLHSRNLTVSRVLCRSGIELCSRCRFCIRLTCMNLYLLSISWISSTALREHFIELPHCRGNVFSRGDIFFYLVDKRGSWDSTGIRVSVRSV